MERLHFNGQGFRYLVKWRRKGSLAWESDTVEDPLQTQFQQEVPDVYGLYEVQVKAENEMGQSHQPAFVYIGRSGESGRCREEEGGRGEGGGGSWWEGAALYAGGIVLVW